MITDGALLRLLAWLSPSFPVGAYSYSHGLEQAVEQGLVRDAPTLTRWIEGIVTFGTGRVDADLFRRAWTAADRRDAVALAETVELGRAWRGTAELALESAAQGRAFLATVRAAWDLSAPAAPDDAPYPVAVAVAAAAVGIPLRPALLAYLHALAANLVSAGVRLVPLGQTDGQRALAALEPVLHDAVTAALARSPDDLGAAAPMVDWTSLRHETQYTRLFRS